MDKSVLTLVVVMALAGLATGTWIGLKILERRSRRQTQEEERREKLSEWIGDELLLIFGDNPRLDIGVSAPEGGEHTMWKVTDGDAGKDQPPVFWVLAQWTKPSRLLTCSFGEGRRWTAENAEQLFEEVRRRKAHILHGAGL